MDFSQLLTAFLASIFAFIFFLIGQLFVGAYERTKSHHFALVNLQFLLNDILGLIAENKGYIRVAREVVNSGSGKVITKLPKPLPADRDYLQHILDDFTLNYTYSLLVDLRILNSHIASFNSAYEKMRDLFLDQKMQAEEYDKNVAKVVTGFENVGKAFDELEPKCKRLLATVRLRIHGEKPLVLKTIDHIIRNYLIKALVLSDEDIKKELEVLEREIAQTKARVEPDETANKTEQL